MTKKPIIISAYPCCGKSYATEHLKDKYVIFDSDSSKFSWITRKRTEEEIKDELDRCSIIKNIKYDFKIRTEVIPEEEYTRIKEELIKVRNPNFIEDYIHHIKECMETADFIFVSSHLQVREALQKEGLDFYTIYPGNDINIRNEWIGRMYSRGSDMDFIKFQYNNFMDFTSKIEDEPHGKRLIRLGHGKYIDEDLLEIIRHHDSNL